MSTLVLSILAALVSASGARSEASSDIFKPCTGDEDCTSSYCYRITLSGELAPCYFGLDTQCFCDVEKSCTSTRDCGDTNRCALYVPGRDASDAVPGARAYCVPCTGGPPGFYPPISIDNEADCSEVPTSPLPIVTPAGAADGSPIYAACNELADCAGSLSCYTLSPSGDLDICSDITETCFCFSARLCAGQNPWNCSFNHRCVLLARNASETHCAPCTGGPPGLPAPRTVSTNDGCGGSAGPTPFSPSSDRPAAPPSAAPVGTTTETAANDPPTEPPAQNEATQLPSTGNASASPSSTPSTPSAASGVCVDAHALSDFPSSQLVFASHQTASVLCDRRGSCATPGHLVVFNGEALTMAEYCKTAFLHVCTRRVMLVNSLRYARGARVASNTPGLYYTVLSSRFETSVEAMLLKGLVRFGL